MSKFSLFSCRATYDCTASSLFFVTA